MSSSRAIWTTRAAWVLAGVAVAAVALAGARSRPDGPAAPASRPATASTSASAGEATTTIEPREVYDPAAAGETLPNGYRPLLDRDQIAPVHGPVFTSATHVDWP